MHKNSSYNDSIMILLNLKDQNSIIILLKQIVSKTPLKPLNRNFVKLCSYEGQTVKMYMSKGNFDVIFFPGVISLLNLEIWLITTWYTFTTETGCHYNYSKPLNSLLNRSTEFFTFNSSFNILCYLTTVIYIDLLSVQTFTCVVLTYQVHLYMRM